MNVWSIRPCLGCGTPVKCEPDYPDDVRVVCGWCIARSVMDDTLGLGAYADANRGNLDPRVQVQVKISDGLRRTIPTDGADSQTAQQAPRLGVPRSEGPPVPGPDEGASA